jgi:hypothetical protein
MSHEYAARPGAFRYVSRRHVWLLAVVGACSKQPSTKPTPVSGSAGDGATAVKSCASRDPDAAHPTADSISIGGDEVKLCWGRGPARSCWRADVALNVLAPQPVTAEPHEDAPRYGRGPAKAEARPDGTIKLCAPGGAPCTSFANPGPTQDPQWIGVSDDLSTVAIPDGETLRIYDVAGAKVRATIKGWPDSPMPHNAFAYTPTFATRDRMIVWYSWSPVSEQGRIFDMSGKQLAIVGKDFMSIDPDKSSWHVHGTEWAIKGEDHTILTVDVNKPQATARYDVSTLLRQPRTDADHDYLGVLAVAGTEKRLIVVTAEEPFTIGVVDRATKQVKKLEPPRCAL